MRYIIAALLLVSGLASVSAQEQIMAGTVSSTAPYSAVSSSSEAIRGFGIPPDVMRPAPASAGLKQESEKSQKEHDDFIKQQVKERREFFRSRSYQDTQKAEDLLNKFEKGQRKARLDFDKKMRKRSYIVAQRALEERINNLKARLAANKEMGEEEKSAYLEYYTQHNRRWLARMLQIVERDAAEQDEINTNSGIDKQTRQQQLKDLAVQQAARHKKELQEFNASSDERRLREKLKPLVKERIEKQSAAKRALVKTGAK